MSHARLLLNFFDLTNLGFPLSLCSVQYFELPDNLERPKGSGLVRPWTPSAATRKASSPNAYLEHFKGVYLLQILDGILPGDTPQARADGFRNFLLSKRLTHHALSQLRTLKIDFYRDDIEAFVRYRFDVSEYIRLNQVEELLKDVIPYFSLSQNPFAKLYFFTKRLNAKAIYEKLINLTAKKSPFVNVSLQQVQQKIDCYLQRQRDAEADVIPGPSIEEFRQAREVCERAVEDMAPLAHYITIGAISAEEFLQQRNFYPFL